MLTGLFLTLRDKQKFSTKNENCNNVNKNHNIKDKKSSEYDESYEHSNSENNNEKNKEKNIKELKEIYRENKEKKDCLCCCIF